jgi:hypothetical protein
MQSHGDVMEGRTLQTGPAAPIVQHEPAPSRSSSAGAPALQGSLSRSNSRSAPAPHRRRGARRLAVALAYAAQLAMAAAQGAASHSSMQSAPGEAPFSSPGMLTCTEDVRTAEQLQIALLRPDCEYLLIRVQRDIDDVGTLPRAHPKRVQIVSASTATPARLTVRQSQPLHPSGCTCAVSCDNHRPSWNAALRLQCIANLHLLCVVCASATRHAAV